MQDHSEVDNTKSVERSALVRRLSEALAHRREVREAYLFGSRATGRVHPESDIDVAVYVDRANATDGTFGYEAELTSDLMARLKTNAIDVVILNKAPPVLYHRVLRDGIRFLSRDLGATATREGQAMSRYCDWIPQLAKMESAKRARTLGSNER